MGKRDSKGPDFSLEKAMQARGFARVAGIDEAGRGPWAGPVVAAAVVLDAACIPNGLNDSKKLPESKRESLFEEIIATADVGVGIGDVGRKLHTGRSRNDQVATDLRLWARLAGVEMGNRLTLHTTTLSLQKMRQLGFRYGKPFPKAHQCHHRLKRVTS